MKKHYIYTTLVALAATIFCGCESSDCTLYNIVALNARFYAGGEKVEIQDTLTITAIGTDSVLINRQLRASELRLPVKYEGPEAAYVLHVFGESIDAQDTIWVKKSSRIHFESPDCATTMFHEIESITSTHHFIDSVSITRQSVNYDQTENIQIHLYSAD